MYQRSIACPRRGGFTLVELLVVILIISIVAAAAAPKFHTATAQHQLSSAARRVAADLQFARDEALRTSSPRRVVFDAVANSYTLPNTPNPRRPAVTYAVSLSAAPFGTDLDQAAFGGQSYVEFNMHGIPHSTGSVRLILNSEKLQVSVDATGQLAFGGW